MTMLATQFGENWPSYLPAAVWCYNASINDAHGFSPYELVMAKGSPSLLQHLDLQPLPEATPLATQSEAEFYKEAGNRVMAAYATVRDQQQRIAKLRNEIILQKKGKLQGRLITFDIGDHILFWEPRQRLTGTTSAKAEDKWTTMPPSKWSYNWSGPFRITAKTPDASGFRYTFWHDERGKELHTHVNKLALFEPWSSGILSTSSQIDSKRAYLSGQWVEVGEFVVLPMLPPYPFGIGRVLNCAEDGELIVHWYSNSCHDPNGAFLPGWVNDNNDAYYADCRRKPGHIAYTNEKDEMAANQRDVAMHSFDLTDAQKRRSHCCALLHNMRMYGGRFLLRRRKWGHRAPATWRTSILTLKPTSTNQSAALKIQQPTILSSKLPTLKWQTVEPPRPTLKWQTVERRV